MNNKRRKLKHNEKQAIKKAWNYKCAYCRDTVTGDACHIDHIVPVKHGGKCEIENLALSCIKCNSQKRDTRLPRYHEGLLLATAARKAPRVRAKMKHTRVAKNKMLNAFITSLTDAIDGYGNEIDQVDIPVNFYINHELIKSSISIPLKDVVYEEFVPDEDHAVPDIKLFILDELSRLQDKTKRSSFTKDVSVRAEVSQRTIDRHLKYLTEIGEVSLQDRWIYPS